MTDYDREREAREVYEGFDYCRTSQEERALIESALARAEAHGFGQGRHLPEFPPHAETCGWVTNGPCTCEVGVIERWLWPEKQETTP